MKSNHEHRHMRLTKPTRSGRLKHNIALFMLVWTLVAGASLTWSLFFQRDSFQATLHTEAAAFHTMEMQYRNWIIRNGGVYVPITAETPPSPWLSQVPERDITTASGKKLTLLNSSYVVRLVHEAMTGANVPLRGHIASLKPINPANKADSWERQALMAFTRGAQEMSSIEVMDDGKTYFRFMRPMITEESCLKCHARYGDKLGDIRGGVSVSVPIDSLLHDERREKNALIGGHAVIWASGIFGLLLGGRRQLKAILEAEQSEAQVTLLTNSIAHAIYGLNMQGCCTFINDAGVRAFGYKHASELLGRKMHELMLHTRADGSLYPYEDSPIFQSIRDGKSFHGDNELFWRRDSTSFPVSYWSYPVFQEGKVNGAVVTFLDMTEQLRVKGELKHSQALLNSIVENIPAMVFLKRAQDLRFELFNRAGERMLGYSRDELLGRNDHDLFPENQADAFTQQDRQTLASRQPREIPEEPVKAADGSDKWLHTFKTALYDEAGNPTHLLGISVDISAQKKMQDELRDQRQMLAQALEGTIHTVSLTAEARDPYTAGHQRRVAQLAVAIAREMGLPEEQIHGIRLAAGIHDLGKIHVPAEILSKPGTLTDVELMLIKTHAQAGYDILKDVDFPWPIADIVHQHHELLDGSGYPRGLEGEQILLEARILTVADVVEAMSSHRPYRPTLGIEAALQKIEQGSGSIYDPKVSDACLKLLREGRFSFQH